MRSTLQLEIQKSIIKLQNLQKNHLQISGKLESLQRELENISKSVEDEEKKILLLGVKQPSRNPEKPDSPEETRKKEEFNQHLFEEKQDLLKSNGIDPDFVQKYKKDSAATVARFDDLGLDW